jgi:hypothetical protein
VTGFILLAHDPIRGTLNCDLDVSVETPLNRRHIGALMIDAARPSINAIDFQRVVFAELFDNFAG